MNLIAIAREQIMNPSTSAERVATMTNLITCGFECGGNNERALDRYWEQVIKNVDEFYAPLDRRARHSLPNGVNTRLNWARNEARRKGEEIKARTKVVIVAGNVLCGTACGSCCESCGICAEP